ncbi:MAG: hypothetical protein AAGF87_12915 [Bacteroidota bacterium]
MKAWTKYGFEFLSIFVAVVLAFALNNWNDNRRDRIAESKILTEIYKGLEKDILDIDQNISGHSQGIAASRYFTRYLNGEPVDFDSLGRMYVVLTRDFVCIQNNSGYENLKSRGLELIRGDSLRNAIISLYEYDFNTLRKVEEEYDELQFFDNYFPIINELLIPHIAFDAKNNPVRLEQEISLSETEQRQLRSLLGRMVFNRVFISDYYEEVKVKVEALQDQIASYLE